MFSKETPFGQVCISCQNCETPVFDVSFEPRISPTNLHENTLGEIHKTIQGYFIYAGAECEDNDCRRTTHFIETYDNNMNLVKEFSFQRDEKGEWRLFYFLICFENYNLLIIKNEIFKIVIDSIEKVELVCTFVDGRELDITQLYRDDSGESADRRPNVIPFAISSSTYVVLRKLLFRIIQNDDRIILESIDESLSIFNWSSSFVEGLGIVTFNFKDDSPSRMYSESEFSKEINSKTGSVFDPIKYSLKYFENENVPEKIISSAHFSLNNNNFFVFLTKKIITKKEEFYVQILGFDILYSDPINIIFDLQDYEYSYHRSYTQIDAKQYNACNDELFGMNSRNNFKFYFPIPPFSNYRICCGYGKVPDSLKSPDYKEISLSDIFLSIGAPIFYSTGDPNAGYNNVGIGSIAVNSDFVYSSTISIGQTFNCTSYIGISSISFIGFVTPIPEASRHDSSEIPVHCWKTPNIQQFVEIKDGESIKAVDPGDLWSLPNSVSSVPNCLGGKWIGSYDLHQERVRYLALCHSEYLNLLKEIPNGELYSIFEGDIIPGKKYDQLAPGWEVIGSVGSDIALSMLCSESHFFNPNDMVFREDIDDLNKIGDFLMTGFDFRPSDRETILRKALSDLYTDHFKNTHNDFQYVPGGVISSSGWGDGTYAVIAKRINDKAVAVYIAFI